MNTMKDTAEIIYYPPDHAVVKVRDNYGPVTEIDGPPELWLKRTERMLTDYGYAVSRTVVE
jgi:hypothetical protein